MALSWTEDRVGPICRHADDCAIVIPRCVLSGDVSRHHCQVQVGFNPPRALVRDLESLNGTYVNGVKIGQRFADPDEPETRQSQLVVLRDGDEVRLGQATAIRVEIRDHAEAIAGAVSGDHSDHGESGESSDSSDSRGGLVGAFASLVRGWRRTSQG